MDDKEILECMKRKLAYNQKCQRACELEAQRAQGRAFLSAKICKGMEIDIARLEAKISRAA